MRWVAFCAEDPVYIDTAIERVQLKVAFAVNPQESPQDIRPAPHATGRYRYVQWCGTVVPGCVINLEMLH